MDIMRTFEHNGRALKVAAYEPEITAMPSLSGASVIAPGTGKFEIGPLNLSAEKIAPGESLTLCAQITGENIAFIYSEILLYDSELGHYYGPVAQEYVLSGKNTEVQGVIYPVWEAEIKLALNLSPSMRILSDGVDSAFAFMRPEGYGQASYQLEGLYNRAGSDSRRRARLKFGSAGEVSSMLIYKERGGRSAPHALTISSGDQFSPFVQILTCSSSEKPVWQVTRGISTALTWREAGFRWTEETPMPGEYLLGLVIQDLDGARTRQYAPFTLEG